MDLVCIIRALSFGVFKTWDSLAHLLPVACTRPQVAKTASVGVWTSQTSPMTVLYNLCTCTDRQ